MLTEANTECHRQSNVIYPWGEGNGECSFKCVSMCVCVRAKGYLEWNWERHRHAHTTASQTEIAEAVAEPREREKEPLFWEMHRWMNGVLSSCLSVCLYFSVCLTRQTFQTSQDLKISLAGYCLILKINRFYCSIEYLTESRHVRLR